MLIEVHQAPRPRAGSAGVVITLVAVLVAPACGTRVAGRFAPPPDHRLSPTSLVVVTTTASAPTSTTLDPNIVKSQIKANWERFFDASTSLTERQALLQDGGSLAQGLAALAQNPLQAKATAKASNIELTAPDQATVTYDVFVGGPTPALAGSQGIAVLQNGTWKVSRESFCGLAALGATSPVPGCS